MTELSYATLGVYFANIHGYGFTRPPAWVPCLFISFQPPPAVSTQLLLTTFVHNFRSQQQFTTSVNNCTSPPKLKALFTIFAQNFCSQILSTTFVYNLSSQLLSTSKKVFPSQLLFTISEHEFLLHLKNVEDLKSEDNHAKLPRNKLGLNLCLVRLVLFGLVLLCLEWLGMSR